jgi:dephospho-CoA kinase
VVVDAPDDVRAARLRGRGLAEADIEGRWRSQPTRSEWLGAADYVVDNSGDIAALEEECRFVWEWMARA